MLFLFDLRLLKLSTCFFMEKTIKIIIADDHRLIREVLKQLLDTNNQFEVIEICENGTKAIEAVKKLKPDIVIMDVDMHPITGFEATEQICKAVPNTKVIGYSNNDEPVYAKKMMEAGAKGYVTKTSHSLELVTAIFKVHAGEEFICEEIKDRMHYRL